MCAPSVIRALRVNPLRRCIALWSQRKKCYETPKSAYQNGRGGLWDSVDWSGAERHPLGEDHLFLREVLKTSTSAELKGVPKAHETRSRRRWPQEQGYGQILDNGNFKLSRFLAQ